MFLINLSLKLLLKLFKYYFIIFINQNIYFK